MCVRVSLLAEGGEGEVGVSGCKHMSVCLSVCLSVHV